MDRRDRVLAAALEIARESGWDRLMIEEVAARSNVTPDEIRRMLPTRAHVAAGIIEKVLGELPDELADELDQASPLRDRLYSCVAHVLRTMERDKSFMRALTTNAALDPEAGALQIPMVASYLDTVAEQIDIARRNREISRFVIPHLAAAAFWLVHLRIIYYWFNDTSDASENTHAVADKWVTAFARSLGAPAPAHPTNADPGLDQ